MSGPWALYLRLIRDNWFVGPHPESRKCMKETREFYFLTPSCLPIEPLAGFDFFATFLYLPSISASLWPDKESVSCFTSASESGSPWSLSTCANSSILTMNWAVSLWLTSTTKSHSKFTHWNRRHCAGLIERGIHVAFPGLKQVWNRVNPSASTVWDL